MSNPVKILSGDEALIRVLEVLGMIDLACTTDNGAVFVDAIMALSELIAETRLASQLLEEPESRESAAGALPTLQRLLDDTIEHAKRHMDVQAVRYAQDKLSVELAAEISASDSSRSKETNPNLN